MTQSSPEKDQPRTQPAEEALQEVQLDEASLPKCWNSQPKLPDRDNDKSVIRYEALEKHFQMGLFDTKACNSTTNLGRDLFPKGTR